MVGSAINRDTAELVGDMEAMPVWSTPYYFIIDSAGDALLGRPLPPGVQQLLPKLTEDSPFGKVSDEHRRIFGRFLSLNDGERVKVVTLSSTSDQAKDAKDVDVLRQLFLRKDRKSTRLNSSHVAISYAVFCLIKKTTHSRE